MHTPLPIDVLPKKVVSLVPSMTESMYELGLGQWMVGCTDYCVYPSYGTEQLTKVGGPKNIKIDLIMDLKPDLIIANQEENRIEEIEILLNQGMAVWAAYPTSVRDSMDDLWGLAGLFQSDHAARVIRSLEDSLDWLKAVSEEGVTKSYFCPIWKSITNSGKTEWMVYNQNTYMNDLIFLFGGINVFGDRELESIKNEKRKRYPVVNAHQIIEARPELIILPDEPYRFGAQDQEELIAIFRESQNPIPRIIRVEGSLIMWHGTRLAKALNLLPEIFQ
jgi:iron complex transport system substrate-binding protein